MVLEDEHKTRFETKGFIYEIYYVLNKYKLNKYYDINIVPKNKNEWNKILNTTIDSFHFERDIKEIKSSKNVILKQIIEQYNITKYSSKIPKIIDNILGKENKNEKIKIISLKIISNSIPLNWKKYELEICPLCFKKWDNPILHIFTDCTHLNDTNLCSTDKKIIKLENITNIIYEIVKNNYDEILHITTKFEKKYESIIK